MTPFVRIESVAASLRDENVDTDMIFPARFLLITQRDGLGRYAFHDQRFATDGTERADFVLNRAHWRAAQILVAGANFGSGSSREQAVWAMAGLGLRCVIAPGFGEIFQANCYRNGVLAVVLPPLVVAELARVAEAGERLTVDLEHQTILAGGNDFAFTIPPVLRLSLMNGWDDTESILNTRETEICAFEQKQRAAQPWLWDNT